MGGSPRSPSRTRPARTCSRSTPIRNEQSRSRPRRHRTGSSSRSGNAMSGPTHETLGGWCSWVSPGNSSAPSFFVVPRCHLAAMLYAQHRWWLAEPGKRGQPHTDNPRRGVAREEVGASRVRRSRVTWSDGTCSRGNLGACRTSANPGTWNCSKPSDCVPSTSRVRCAHARNANWTLYPTLRSVSGQNAPRCLSRCPLGERGRWRPLSVTVCPVCL